MFCYWLRVLHTLPRECLAHALVMHLTCTLDAPCCTHSNTWPVLHSLILVKYFRLVNTYIMCLVSMSYLGLYLVPSSLACHVYFILCSILCFCHSFEFHFLIRFEPLMHHTLAHIFFSFLPSSWLICLFVTKRGRLYKRVYRCVSSCFYDSCAHSLGEKFYLVHIRKGRKP